MLTLYNTFTRKKQPFKSIAPGHIRMYVCGITVYDYCHMGHARMLIVFDMIYRWLLALGFHVVYVRNITDIDDKIIQRAIENQESITTLTDRFIRLMHEDAAALNLLSPTFEPRATSHIDDILALIDQLVSRGHAYQADQGDIYYAVRTFPHYGQLSGKSVEDLRVGARVEVDAAKRDPLDFVLWKRAKPGEPAWASPWGSGRPGWHIECSAMSCHHLGPHFDIHGGGADLQFPHHENEIAQSEGAHGHPYVNYWLHNGFIQVNGQKMSKSLGNFFTIRDVLAHFDPEVLRFFVLRTHYRSPVNFSDTLLEDARLGLTRLYTALKGIDLPADTMDWNREIDWNDPFAAHFKLAMNDDFNTPEAISVLFELAGKINRAAHPEKLTLARLLKQLGSILGLLTRDPLSFLQSEQCGTHHLEVTQIESLIAEREIARKTKNFTEADRIRTTLDKAGIALEDSPDGITLWRRK